MAGAESGGRWFSRAGRYRGGQVGPEVLEAMTKLVATREQSRTALALQTANLGLYEGVSMGGDPKSMVVLAQAAEGGGRQGAPHRARQGVEPALGLAMAPARGGR